MVIFRKVCITYLVAMMSASCVSCDTTSGTISGAGGGAVIGGLVTDSVGGALIGGAVGGLLGNVIGREVSADDRKYIEDHAQDLLDQAYASGSVKVTRSTGAGAQISSTEVRKIRSFRDTKQRRCADFTQYVTMENRTHRVDYSACIGSNGRWVQY